MKPEIDEKTKKGIEAIIFLQGLAKIKETEEEALLGWKNMTEDEREFTLGFYDILKEK